MYELNEILERYGKNLKYLEIRSLCFLKEGKLIHLASHIQFVEKASSDFIEQKNNILFIQSYIIIEPKLDRFFSELQNGTLINKEKIPVTISFDYDKLKFNFYRTYENGHFQCELRGKNHQNSDSDFMKGIYSFGTDSFYALSKEKIGIGIQNIDETIYLRLPIKMNGELQLKSKTECTLQIESDLLQEDFLYSIRFFNIKEYYDTNNKEHYIKQIFKQTSAKTLCTIPATIDLFTEYNTVLVDIYDTDLGIILCSKNLRTRDVLAKSNVYTSILQEAYSVFRNPENFQKSILQPSQDAGKQRPQKRFELEISRLLNCGGLQAIWLENNDNIKEGEITTISADI